MITLKRKIAASISLIIITLCGSILLSQDISTFELMGNNEVGLTVAPFAKRGECLVDIDRNGWQDIYILKYNGPDYSRLYTNENGHFTDITAQTPLKQIEDVEGVRTFNVVWADYDNDGDKDCSFGTNKAIYLLRNDNNFLTDVSAQMGFVGKKPGGFITEWHYGVDAWADYDLDGDLDCVVYQMNYPNLYLFRNDGDHFTDVAAEAGLNGTKLSIDTFMNPIVFTDWDMDGDPDLCGRQDFYANENGVFREVTAEIGLSGVSWTNHKEFFDYDNDGDLDYFNVTGRSYEGENQLWENRDGLYVNVSQDVNLTLVRENFRGVAIGDFDNDGDQDIFVQRNVNEGIEILLLNEVVDGARVFTDIAEFVGLTKTGDRIGGGFFDYNKDGFLDIYIPSAEHSHILYRNTAENGGNWVGFILEGTVSNRDALGSIIWLYYAGGKMQLRYTKASCDYLRQDMPWVHFGLGFETSVDSVVIRWPLGHKQVLKNVEINQYHEVKEPESSAVASFNPESAKSDGFWLEQNYPNPFNPATTIKYRIAGTKNVNLTIYDVTGRVVRTLMNHQQQAGFYSVIWDGQDDEKNLLPSGVYVSQLRAGDEMIVKKMLYIK